MLRTLTAWLNLSILLAAGWPLIVIIFDAPSVNPEHLPVGWFILRTAIPVAALLATVALWRASGASLETLRPRALVPNLGNRISTQILIFLVGLTIVLSVLLLLDRPVDGIQVILYGLAESAAVQLLVPGFVLGTLETLRVSERRSFWLCLVLLALTVTLQTVALTGVQDDATLGAVLNALVAGLLVGGLFGWLWLWLRDRTGSIWPGVLAQLLLIALIPAFM